MSAYYRATLGSFLADDPNRVLGELTAGSAGSGFVELKHRQTIAWQREIEILRACSTVLISEDASRSLWTLLLEYPIPRRQKRIDAVVLAADIILCIEFKTEDKSHNRQTQLQVEDYSLDLRDFHEQSRGRSIVPFAVSAKADVSETRTNLIGKSDCVRPIRLANAIDLASQISRPLAATKVSLELVLSICLYVVPSALSLQLSD